MWEKWYEAILEEEKLQDIRVQCVDFCEAMTSKVHAVLQHAPFDLRGGTFRQHPRFLVATVDYQGKTTPLHADTPCCHVPGFSRCIRTTPIAGRHLESGDSVASGRDSTAAECLCPEWSRNGDYQNRSSQCVPC